MSKKIINTKKKKYDYIKILYKSHKHGLWVLLNYPKVFMGLGHDLRFLKKYFYFYVKYSLLVHFK